MPSVPKAPKNYVTPTPLDPSFEKDVLDHHLIYDYDAPDSDEKWRYEMYFASANQVIYAIHGGPMAGRYNYQTAAYQCIRPGEFWQVNWLEETGSVVSLVWDIKGGMVTTLISFSQGHWEQNEAAKGDKRKPADFARWRKLAETGNQTDRLMLSDRGKIVESFMGRGDLKEVEEGAETI